MDLMLYGLKTCDTCRKAQRELAAAGHVVRVTDVRADGVPAAELARFHAFFGDDLVNRRSTTWRNLSEEDRASDPLALLAAHPTLMKRMSGRCWHLDKGQPDAQVRPVRYRSVACVSLP